MSSSSLGSPQGESRNRLITVCLDFASRVNTFIVKLTACLQVVVLPQVTWLQRRGYLINLLNLMSHDLMLIACAKTLALFFNCNNFILLLSVSSILPFFWSVYNTWRTIPCPPIVEVFSNILLVVGLVAMVGLGVSTFKDEVWSIYTFTMASWPWLVVCCIAARMYVEKSAAMSPFSPLLHFPSLGVLGGLGYALMMRAAKELTVTDTITLICLDPVLTAMVGSVVIGSARRRMHFKYIKFYALLIAGVLIYSTGDQPSDYNEGKTLFVLPLTTYHYQFLLARLLFAVRSFTVKRAYQRYYHAKQPPRPPENELLFYNNTPPAKHRFKKFPVPTLLTLDTVFDSGLRDIEFHGMGPMGTVDLHVLTENAYMLPIASLMAWIVEADTLNNGIFSDAPKETAVTIEEILAEASGLTTEPPDSGLDSNVALFVMGLLCVAQLLRGPATARVLFDKGSSMYSWKYQPIIVCFPFFFYDAIFLNDHLSKFQIVLFIALAGIFAHHRDLMWNSFKRKYLLLCTQELQYVQPSCVRSLQRRTMLEFLVKSSTDDYAMLLLDTSIKHGKNMRLLAENCNLRAFDPSPSATAAWKLAVSLVTKALKRNQMRKRQKDETEETIKDWLAGIVLDIVYKAVDEAEGHGRRLKHAGALSNMFAKRQALRQLRNMASSRRRLRQNRLKGQLATAKMHLATVGGVLRPLQILDPQPEPPGFPQLPPPPRVKHGVPGGNRLGALKDASEDLLRAAASTGALPATMSLTSGAMSLETTEGTPTPSLPGAADDSPRSNQTGSSGSNSGGTSGKQSSGGAAERHRGPLTRGIWGIAATTGTSRASGEFMLPGGSIVIAFGDSKRGQLALSPAEAEKHLDSGASFTVVEGLRGYDPVQVEAAGVCSLVVGARGHVWGFGSNRSMELGSRKEVAQISGPQRIKSIRDHELVQVVSSKAASGQAVSLALTSSGQVLTWGTSSRGALGQGQGITQSAPLLLRMTLELPVKLVAAGAYHSMIVTDEGLVFAFGDNTFGQLGIGARKPPVHFVDLPEPLNDFLKETGPVRYLTCGDNHNLALAESGQLYSWGANANGQLGLYHIKDQSTPQPVIRVQDGIITLAAGARHSIAVAQNGAQLWAWGSNAQGQLGVGPNSEMDGQVRIAPSLVKALSNKKGIDIVQVAAASGHSLALTRSGQVYAWGENTHGQLGFVSEATARRAAARNKLQSPTALAREKDDPRRHRAGVDRLWEPERVTSLSLYNVRAVATGEMHSLALAL